VGDNSHNTKCAKEKVAITHSTGKSEMKGILEHKELSVAYLLAKIKEEARIRCLAGDKHLSSLCIFMVLSGVGCSGHVSEFPSLEGWLF
jgi:hypothetical protein